MTDTNKSPIRLRKRKLLNGNISLYLDIYHKDGKRDYEFLKPYLIPEKTRADKEKNKQTMQLDILNKLTPYGLFKLTPIDNL